MSRINSKRRAYLGTALAALAMSAGTVAFATPAAAQAARPSETLNLSQNTGTLVRLSGPMSDLFVANDNIADVQVRSSTQLYVFGKAAGETTVYATDKSGRVVYAANVRVGTNVGSVGEMLRMAMPEASVTATPMNNLVLLTGTVASPDEAADAQRLVQAYVGDKTQVVSRLRTATPLQVTLKVRIAEVNRTLLREVGMNLFSLGDRTGGFKGGIFQGGSNNPIQPDGKGGFNIFQTVGTVITGRGNVFGTDILGALNLAETDGFVTTLAEPTLTALSGETASVLAGGEFPIPVASELGKVEIEYKEYGVGLAFTPIVLANGRISMRVRPEVSELSNEGSIKLNGFEIPALSTRRAESTVELGSGQSFMLAGLLRNGQNNQIEKAPFLGDLPILGALFRSTKYRRAETELVIIITPYLVRPVSGHMPIPTDGMRAPSGSRMVVGGQVYDGQSGVGIEGEAVPAGPARAPAGRVPVASNGTAAPGFKL
jgi:pilus assembly protein CpaC